MIVYNTSFFIDRSIEHDFLSWLRDVAPTMGRESGLTDPRLCRVLSGVDEGCSSFALQFLAADAATVYDWENGARNILMSHINDRWGDKALAFSTYMEIMDL